jgi:hypothetical protein
MDDKAENKHSGFTQLHGWGLSTGLTLTALVIDTIATIIITLHVIVLHGKLTVNEDNNQATVVLNDREGAERILLILAVALYLVSFIMLIVAQVLSHSQFRKQIYILERRLNLNLHDLSQVRMADIYAFEKKRGIKLDQK